MSNPQGLTRSFALLGFMQRLPEYILSKMGMAAQVGCFKILLFSWTVFCL
jgi:hypothetical protein